MRLLSVDAYHSDQWCFGAVGSYSPMVRLCLSQKLCQRRNVQVAESSFGKPCLDLLEQPGVAVRITERGEREIAGMVGCGPPDSTARAVALELRSRCPGVEHLADLGPTGDEVVACRLDLGDDQVEALGRARRARRDVRAEKVSARYLSLIDPASRIRFHTPRGSR